MKMMKMMIVTFLHHALVIKDVPSLPEYVLSLPPMYVNYQWHR